MIWLKYFWHLGSRLHDECCELKGPTLFDCCKKRWIYNRNNKCHVEGLLFLGFSSSKWSEWVNLTRWWWCKRLSSRALYTGWKCLKFCGKWAKIQWIWTLLCTNFTSERCNFGVYWFFILLSQECVKSFTVRCRAVVKEHKNAPDLYPDKIKNLVNCTWDAASYPQSAQSQVLLLLFAAIWERDANFHQMRERSSLNTKSYRVFKIQLMKNFKQCVYRILKGACFHFGLGSKFFGLQFQESCRLLNVFLACACAWVCNL